jgi:hypothetical protein
MNIDDGRLGTRWHDDLADWYCDFIGKGDSITDRPLVILLGHLLFPTVGAAVADNDNDLAVAAGDGVDLCPLVGSAVGLLPSCACARWRKPKSWSRT